MKTESNNLTNADFYTKFNEIDGKTVDIVVIGVQVKCGSYV